MGSMVPVIEASVHGADLSNTCKPLSRSIQWTDRVLAEFFAQGDRERFVGRDISPLCDRRTVSRPGSQVGFIDFIIKPTFLALSQVCDITVALDNMETNRCFWAELVDKEKKAALQRSDTKGSKGPWKQVHPGRFNTGSS